MDTRTGLPVVGMVGGGQLARMTHQAAIALGQSLRVLAVSPDDGAALVAADVVLGVGTNHAFLRRLLQHPDVRAGRLDTGLVERELDGLLTTAFGSVSEVVARLKEAIDAHAEGGGVKS